MNVQLTGNRPTHRPATEAPEHVRVARAYDVSLGSTTANRLALTAEHDHKWYSAGVFYLMAGWIILNSGWSTDGLGYPLMLVGLLLPLVPVMVAQLANRKAQAAQQLLATSELEARKRTGRGLVYELNSRDYSKAV